MTKHRPGDFVLVQVSADRSIIGQIRHIHDFIPAGGDNRSITLIARRKEAEMQWFWSCRWFPVALSSAFHPSELIRDHSDRIDQRVDMTKITAKCVVLYLPATESVPHDEIGSVSLDFEVAISRISQSYLGFYHSRIYHFAKPPIL